MASSGGKIRVFFAVDVDPTLKRHVEEMKAEVDALTQQPQDTGETDVIECNRPAHQDGHHAPGCYGGAVVTKIKHGGRWYEPALPYEIQSSADNGIEIRPKFPSGEFVQEFIKKCDHCGRGDLAPVVYYSFEEAVNAGLFVEVSVERIES